MRQKIAQINKWFMAAIETTIFPKMIAIVRCARTETIKFLNHLSSISFFLPEWHHVRWREKPTNPISRCYCGNHLCYTHLNKLITTLLSKDSACHISCIQITPKKSMAQLLRFTLNIFTIILVPFSFFLWALGATRKCELCIFASLLERIHVHKS